MKENTKYFKQSVGIVFVLMFMLSIILCALFLFFKKQSPAESIAICAYFALLTGIIFRYIETRKQKD